MGEKFEAKWFVSVDDVVATFRYIYDQVGGSELPTAAQSAGTAIQAAQLTQLRNILGSGARVESLYTRRITADPIPAWMGNFQDATGTGIGDALHAQQALLINLRNTQGLLKRSGRVYIPGMADSGILNGSVHVDFGTNFIQAYLDTLIDIPAGGSDNWEGKLNVERNQIDLVPQVPPVYVEVDAVDYTDTLGTQHRRKGELRGYKPAPV